MRVALRAWVLSTMLAVSACVTHDNVKQGTQLGDLAGDSVIVMGVSPNYQVEIEKGFADDGTVAVSHAAGALSVYPHDGYIVGRVTPRTGKEVHLLFVIRPEGYGVWVPQYMPCNGDETATFEVPSGKIVYVGDVTFGPIGKKVAVGYSSNFANAKKYVSAHYPELSGSLVESPMVLRKMKNFDCSPRHMMIPIYIRR